MTAAALLLAASAALAAPKPAKPAAKPAPQAASAAVASVIAEAERLVAEQGGRDAREVAALDRRAASLRARIAPLGWRAAEALGAAAKDKKRPVKVRLLAASFLGLVRDPAAFAPLEELLLDKEQDPDVRAVAAQSLAAQNVDRATLRAALCAAAAREDMPEEALDQTLLSVEKLGCAEPGPLVRVARAAGARPSGRALLRTRLAFGALARSPGDAADRALLDLLGYFPRGGDARAAAVSALALRPAGARRLKAEYLPAVVEALDSETGRPAVMLKLILIASWLGPEAGDALARLARHTDAEVLAAAADALAGLGRVDALPALEEVVAGALRDPRFSPREGRPDPAALLSRVEAAAERLRRLAPERPRPAVE